MKPADVRYKCNFSSNEEQALTTGDKNREVAETERSPDNPENLLVERVNVSKDYIPNSDQYHGGNRGIGEIRSIPVVDLADLMIDNIAATSGKKIGAEGHGWC